VGRNQGVQQNVKFVICLVLIVLIHLINWWKVKKIILMKICEYTVETWHLASHLNFTSKLNQHIRWIYFTWNTINKGNEYQWSIALHSSKSRQQYTVGYVHKGIANLL
jgi:hypothetical protein